MKKLNLVFAFLVMSSISILAQERIVSFGYGKTFVDDDSSTFVITFDLNRIPGSSEKGGGYFFINEPIGDSKLGYYLKPSMDLNIGSGTSSAPNNISLGFPFGLAYDFIETSAGIFTLNLEFAPEGVSDKSLANTLLYFSMGPFLQYEFTEKKYSVYIATGANYALGNRYISEASDNSYRRLNFPTYLKFRCWSFKKDPTKYRIHLSSIYKNNRVLKDTESSEQNYSYLNFKFDFYLIPTLGINITYNNGHEEPLFKRNNSISFGITLAR